MKTFFVDGHGRCEVWELPKISSTKQRKFRYTPDSFVHPAKMNIGLCRKIIETYTKRDEVVLDPMAGVSSTQIEAALLGRNAIGTEIEGKFVKTSKKNIRLLEKLRTLSPKGEAIVLKGDARKLTELLMEQADAVIFSPPFGDAEHHKEHGLKDLSGEGFKGRKAWKERRHIQKKYDKKNISKLKYGQPDVIVFSPPFAGTSGGKGEKSRVPINARYAGLFERCIGGNKGGISDNPENIDNFSYGKVDVVVFSPPYAGAQRGGGIAQKGYDGPKHSKTDLVGRRTYMPENVGKSKGQISRLDYGPVEDNIGNKKIETYLSAMLQVYAECFKVIKSGGLMVLVVKNFIRNKKVVRLDLDTKRLCEVVGFQWIETKLFRVQIKSFWRIIYEQKHPEVDTKLLEYEFVEVFQKPIET